MRDLEGVVVEFEFAGQILVGRVTDRLQEADIARGPVDLFQITTADDATYRVPEGDIRAT